MRGFSCRGSGKTWVAPLLVRRTNALLTKAVDLLQDALAGRHAGQAS